MTGAASLGVRTLCLIAICLLGLFGCHRQGDVLAELREMRGAVERDVAAAQGKWNGAAVGDAFRVNDGVRTSLRASAKLVLSDGSRVGLKEKTVLRFLASAPGKRSRALDVQAGEVTLDVGGEALELETQFGPAVLVPGSRVHLRRLEDSTRLAVEIGSARLVRDGRQLEAGDAVDIGIGSAVLVAASASAATPEPVAPVDAPPSAAAASALPAASASAAPGSEPDNRPHGPDRVDLWAGPGDSMIIHDAHPPTAIGFAASRCSGLLVLELGGKGRATVGSGRVSASFAPGAHRYRLRCDADVAAFAEGTMTVLSDSGSRRLSTAAPSNRIDTDGRRYTILYQSLLPKLSVRWPTPPAGSAFTLVVASQGKGQRRFAAPTASYSLPAGALAEGSHELWFEAGADRSRTTTVVIQFDNAAPTASISSPAEGSFAPGSSVDVQGTALPGFSVYVGGQVLQQDSQQRFSGQVVAPSDAAAIAIRFSHPLRGVHYYLRRSSR